MLVIGKSKKPGASLGLETCPVYINLRRKVRRTVHCLRNGSADRIASLNAKAGK